MTSRTALMLFVFAACAAVGVLRAPRGHAAGEAPAARAEHVLVGLSMDTLKEARWQRDRDMMVARAKALGAEVLVQSANGDDARQISDVVGLLTRHVDVLIVIAHDGKAMAKAVGLAHEAGVPVLAYDRLIVDSNVDAYVSFDNVRVGALQAKYVVDHLATPGKGKIVRVLGSKTDHNAVLVKKGQDEVLAPYLERGDIRIIHEDWADDWKPENAKKIVNAAISVHGHDFEAVLASSDGTASGAVQALSEEGLAGKVLVTGQDAELVACQRVVGGTQSMTVYKPLRHLADSAMELAVQLSTKHVIVAKQSVYNGKVDVPAVLLDVVVATRENMMETVVGDGFFTRQEVYGGP
ncbi:MAG TPA: substrate-binding domain-containing protein [Polyangiaceae bacterium]